MLPIFCSDSAFKLKMDTVFNYDSRASVYAGSGYSISTGKPAIVICNGIEGALSCASGLLTAWGDKCALVVVCILKEEEMKILKIAFARVSRRIIDFSIDPELTGLTADYLSFPAVIFCRDARDINQALRKLSVVLEDKIYSVTTPSLPESNSIDRAIDLINNSQNPVILAGKGAGPYIDRLITLSMLKSIPLLLTAGATTLPVKQIELLSKSDGIIIPSGNPVWLRAFVSADLLIVLGSGLSEVDWFGLKDLKIHRGKVLRVDSDQIALNERISDLKLNIDINDFLEIFAKKARTFNSQSYEKLKSLTERWKRVLKEETEKLNNISPIHPSVAAMEILNGAEEGTIFVSEGGACGMWLWTHLWLKPFVFPVQNGTIGVSIPMSIGVKYGFPSRKVWAIMGDGAIFYHLRELKNAIDQGLPIGLFVFNDRSWGAIRIAQRFIYRSDFRGTDIPDCDYAGIAESFGCEGISVRTRDELLKAIDLANNLDRTIVVDIKIKRDAIPIAGANFVISEFDGVLKRTLLGLTLSAFKNIAKRELPIDVFRTLRRTLL